MSIAFKSIICLFLSTLSLRRATLETLAGAFLFHISIHALLAESDAASGFLISSRSQFLSTLSLRRATIVYAIKLAGAMLFLSTLSLRRATSSDIKKNLQGFNFYPRSPCGERRANNRQEQQEQHISIHALLAESDSKSAQNSGALLRI